MREGEGLGEILATLRRWGPLLAWLVALVSGTQSVQRMDLLETVLRGAGTWLGTWIIWLVGLGLMERIAGGEPLADPPRVSSDKPKTQ